MNLPDSVIYGLLALLLFSAELLYFRIAERYRILDKPNERSSHTRPTVRGGGVIFVVGLICWFFLFGIPWPFFMAGITAAAVVSFIDDVRSLPARIRFVVHLLAVVAIFYSIGLFHWPVWLWLLALVVSIGALNAFNFMDGINGITGMYALASLLTFLYIEKRIAHFTESSFIVVNIIGVIIFLYFNYRRRARCFAGDVGSVTIAFVLIFLLLQLIYTRGNLLWVMLFLVYGLDSVVTILYRLKRRENIFKPHRTHLYQYLCNELKWQHRSVSAIYAAFQLLLNAVLVYLITHDLTLASLGIGLLASVFYCVTRKVVLQKIRAAAK